MKNFFAVFIVSCILLVICISLFQGLAIIVVPCLLIAGGVAMYMDISKRIDRIEEHLGLSVPKEESLTITERWEKERAEREAEQMENQE